MDSLDVKWCDTCKCHYVKCPKCGNNTCNGGYGTVDGKPCDKCPEAYAYDKSVAEQLIARYREGMTANVRKTEVPRQGNR